MNASIAESSSVICRFASNMNEFTQERSRMHASIVINASAPRHIVSNMNEVTQE